MIRGSTDHAPKSLLPSKEEVTAVEQFIKRIRHKRNKLESQLRKCEIVSTRQTLMRNIEMYNIMLEEFNEPAYSGKKHKARF